MMNDKESKNNSSSLSSATMETKETKPLLSQEALRTLQKADKLGIKHGYLYLSSK